MRNVVADARNHIRYQVYKRDSYTCHACGMNVSPMVKRAASLKNMATIEFKKPLSTGGKFKPSNMMTCCYDCNPYKGGWIHYFNRNQYLNFQIGIKVAKTPKGLRKKARRNIQNIIDRYGTNCYICNNETYKNATDKNKLRTIDHVIPISKGGDSSIDNLRICCYPCNIEKSDSIITK